MSTMAMAPGGIRSTLNPNAPLFIPVAIQQVEDFSPEWWKLVETSTWYREHWYHQYQEQETFDCDEEEGDIANMLPDSVDLDFENGLSNLETEMDELYNESLASDKKSYSDFSNQNNGFDIDAASLIRSLTLTSPKNGSAKAVMEPAKHLDKPVKCVSPKPKPRIIHQPR